MVGSVATTRYTFTPHLRVPPTVERACGEISQASQIRTDGSSRWTKLTRRTAMGPARHPHCAQRRYRVFVSRAGIRSATDSPGRFRPSWAGDSGCSTVPSATPRDSSLPGTETVNPARHQSVCVPSTLAHSAYVFVRRDSHRSPLTPPYEGPYKVLTHGEKSFVLDYGNRHDSVSIDRLKPAHLDPEIAVEAAKRAPQPPSCRTHTRAGRQVRRPERYAPGDGC